MERNQRDPLYWQGHHHFQDVSQDLAATIKKVELAAGDVMELQKCVKTCLKFAKKVVKRCEQFSHFYYMVARTVTESGKRLRDINDQMIGEWAQWRDKKIYHRADLAQIEARAWPQIIKRTHGDLLIFQDLKIQVKMERFEDFLNKVLVIKVRGTSVEDCNPAPQSVKEKKQMTREFRQLFLALEEADISGGVVAPTQTKSTQADLNRHYNKIVYYSPQRTSASPRRSHSNSSGHRSNREIPELTHRAINTDTIQTRNHHTQTIGTQIQLPISPVAHHSSGSLLRPQELSFGKVISHPQSRPFTFQVKKPIVEITDKEDDL